jgi:hypothetical protein
MAVHLASQADSLRGALAQKTAALPEEKAPLKTPPPAEILLTRQVRTIAKLQKQTEKHRSAVAAAEEGVQAAQNLLAAQRERLAKAEARLQEAEDTRNSLVAGLQKEAPPQGSMEVDPPPKEDREPLAHLDSAVLPFLCTFLGQLLGSGSNDDLANMAAGLRERLHQHIPDPQRAALALLGGPTLPAAPTPDAAAAAAAAEQEALAEAAAAADSSRAAELPPPPKKQASEKKTAKVASLVADAAPTGPTPAGLATSSGDEADEEEETDPGTNRNGRSRSPRDRHTTKKHKRDPHEPKSPTPEREEA